MIKQFIDGDILHAEDLNNIVKNTQGFDWSGKTIAFYGDSVTAAGNGDFSCPFNGTHWTHIIGDYMKFEKLYVRGIGGQRFNWINGGGTVSFIYSDTGNLHSRKDGKNLDDYDGEIPEGCVAVRGCGCSFLRMSKMFPENIRSTIDCVFVIYHNDASSSTKNTVATWKPNDTTDKEWAESEYYSKYGGDYNIEITAGAIVSTVMKLQALLPNAVIVLGTPVAGRGTVGQINPSQNTYENYNVELKDVIQKIGSQFGIPVIDVFGTSGINGLNRNIYIYDGIHPNQYGNTMMARAIIGGLKNIIPRMFTFRKFTEVSNEITVTNSTINQPQQGVEGFTAGKTYSYDITTDYEGTLTLYSGYHDYTASNGWRHISTVLNVSCSPDKSITGTLNLPESIDGKIPELIIIRTNTTNKVKVKYKFTLLE